MATPLRTTVDNQQPAIDGLNLSSPGELCGGPVGEDESGRRPRSRRAAHLSSQSDYGPHQRADVVATAEAARPIPGAVVTALGTDEGTVAQVILTPEGEGFVLPINLDPWARIGHIGYG